MIVYKIQNIINGKMYIGQTTKPLRTRINRHFLNARNKISHPLYNSINKYGKEYFIIEILEIAGSLEELNFLEKYYIKHYDTLNINLGYNLKEGGNNAKLPPHVVEIIKRIQTGRVKTQKELNNIAMRNKGKKMLPQVREALKKANVGKKLSSKHIELLRKINTGRKASAEARAKMSEAQLKRNPPSLETRKKLSNGRLGKVHSEESKQKMRDGAIEAHKRRKQQATLGNVKGQG